MSAFAIVLVLGAAAAWMATTDTRGEVKAHVRAAALLYAVLALSVALGIAPATVAEIVAAPASALLCLAAYAAFRVPAGVFAVAAALSLAALTGIASVVSGVTFLAMIAQFVAATVMLVLARRRGRPGIYLALAAASLIGAAVSMLVEGIPARVGVLLFSTAALVGTAVAIASDFFVKSRRASRARTAVRRAG